MQTPPALVYWLFGRSGAGKTTIARAVQQQLKMLDKTVLLLDGDQLRNGVCAGLGFASSDRLENHRRIAHIAKLASQQGIIVIAATMAPENVQREAVSQVLGQTMRWVYIDASLEVCIQRDPKGLYRKKNNEMVNYPFDPPNAHQTWMWIDTNTFDAPSCATMLLDRVILDH